MIVEASDNGPNSQARRMLPKLVFTIVVRKVNRSSLRRGCAGASAGAGSGPGAGVGCVVVVVFSSSRMSLSLFINPLKR